MIRALAVLALAVLASGCAGLGEKSPAARETTLARITQTRTLRVGLSGDQPPFNMTTQLGEVIGLEPALANVLARSLGVKTELVVLPFSELLDALEADRVDVVMSGMTITPERNLRAAFVGPYYVSGKSLLTKRETFSRIENPGQLNQHDARFAALAGSTSERFVQRFLPQAQLTSVVTTDAGVALVLDGSVDALIADLESCVVAMLKRPNAGLFMLRKPFTVEPIGIAVRPDEPLLQNMLENYLDALERTGGLDRAIQYWFEDRAWIQALPGAEAPDAPQP